MNKKEIVAELNQIIGDLDSVAIFDPLSSVDDMEEILDRMSIVINAIDESNIAW